MEYKSFLQKNGFYDSSIRIIDKVIRMFYYYHIFEEKTEVDLSEVRDDFVSFGLNKPNITDLRNNIKKSSYFLNGSNSNSFKLNPMKFDKLRKVINLDKNVTEVVVHDYIVLPRDLYKNSYPPIQEICNHINSCYELNIYTACSVLMRRLLETLIILCYEKLNIQNEIKSNGSYIGLKAIITNAKTNTILNLRGPTKNHIELFKDIGDWSAHRMYYICRYDDLEKNRLKFRAIIEELLTISGTI